MKKVPWQTDEPEILIPVHIELDHPTPETCIAEILEQHEKYGFSQFLLACPSGGWRGVGYPPAEVWDELAERYAKIRDAVAPRGIRCGWWLVITLKTGRLSGAVPFVSADGRESPFANCPLDPAFRKRFSEDVARFARIAKPELILTEDDFSVNAGAGKLGCFCAHHLAEFNRRTGISYDRESLVSALTAGTKEAEELDRAWRELKKDSLVLLAEEMRRALDQDSPEIPMGPMQATAHCAEGNALFPIAKAMAGPRHTPFARICGTFYSGVTAREIPQKLYRPLWMRQHGPEDFFYLHESDTYPQSRFFTTGTAMKAVLAAVYSFGFAGSTFQTQQLLDDPNEESGVYGEMFARERPRFRELVRKASLCRVHGARIPFDPSYSTPLWTDAVARMAIPYTTADSPVAFWDETYAAHAASEEVLRALSGGLILDGDAAAALCRRGYGEFLGVSVGEDAETGLLRFDNGAREVMCEGFIPESKGRRMPPAHLFAPGGNGIERRLTVTDPKTEVVAELRTFRNDVVCPSVTRFENRLGGRVAVMGETLANNRSQSLFNLRRQRLLQQTALWCGADFVFAPGVPDLFLIENLPLSPDAGFRAMLTLINLCDDTPDPFEFCLPESLRGAGVFVMDNAGAWQKAAAEKTENGFRLLEHVRHYEPVYLLLK